MSVYQDKPPHLLHLHLSPIHPPRRPRSHLFPHLLPARAADAIISQCLELTETTCLDTIIVVVALGVVWDVNRTGCVGHGCFGMILGFRLE